MCILIISSVKIYLYDLVNDWLETIYENVKK